MTGAAGRDGSVDGPRCTVKDDHATIGVEVLDAPDGGKSLDGFDGGGQRDVTFEGMARQVDMTSFVLDTCAPNADCATNSIRVTIAAPDLTLLGTGLDTGSLARVHFVTWCFYGCKASIVVSSLKTWGGLTNQRIPRGGAFYVAADEGGVLVDAPYKWDAVRLPCPTSFDGGCHDGTDQPPGIYALRFDNQIVVPMGDYGYIPYGGYSVMVRNLRSYVTGASDDYWNYAHWATPVVFGD